MKRNGENRRQEIKIRYEKNTERFGAKDHQN